MLAGRKRPAPVRRSTPIQNNFRCPPQRSAKGRPGNAQVIAAPTSIWRTIAAEVHLLEMQSPTSNPGRTAPSSVAKSSAFHGFYETDRSESRRSGKARLGAPARDLRRALAALHGRPSPSRTTTTSRLHDGLVELCTTSTGQIARLGFDAWSRHCAARICMRKRKLAAPPTPRDPRPTPIKSAFAAVSLSAGTNQL